MPIHLAIFFDCSMELGTLVIIIISQAMLVPQVSFRSVAATSDKNKCAYGYVWGRFGCLRGIYKAVQKPGQIFKAVSLPPMTTKRKPYTLPTSTVSALKKKEVDDEEWHPYMNKEPPELRRDSNTGLWAANMSPEPKPKMRAKEPEWESEREPEPEQEPEREQEIEPESDPDRDLKVFIVGDIEEPTTLPYWQPKWKRKPSTPKSSKKKPKITWLD